MREFMQLNEFRSRSGMRRRIGRMVAHRRAYESGRPWASAATAEATHRQLRDTFVSHLRTTEKKSDWITDKVRIAQPDFRLRRYCK
jgi:hypothetical protein